ncbi:MAG: hypothetical protein A3J29_23075 [Acidobacteria bacterium RIFCSPLOWO2_12_FULL_67_14b]|nr:MAG: hypothetical protein A3I61_13520 [Acidobacteria bacterium RIFCSPLOWO2_02_FULL_68_18]OFW45392.1 MAG: hypothetical protein A3J29_23075 [Acidobacteria bacterium RIFCSPLOWO2_12_FULL_67_14b]
MIQIWKQHCLGVRRLSGIKRLFLLSLLMTVALIFSKQSTLFPGFMRWKMASVIGSAQPWSESIWRSFGRHLPTERWNLRLP